MVKKHNRQRLNESINYWDSILFKFSTKIFLGIIVILVFLTLAQCTVKKPESPTWNTNLVVPVINRTYDMNEIIDKIDQEGLTIDSQGTISFSITQDLDTVQLLPQDLSTGDLAYNVSQNLGLINIDAPSVNPVTINLSSIAGLISSGLPNDQALLIPLGFNLYNDMPTISNFTQATISNGQMNTIVDNNLGVDLDTVILEIYDVGRSIIIATDSFENGISAGTVDTLSISLDGLTISNSLRINTTCFTPGGIVTQASTRYIETKIEFGNGIEISSATAEVPAINPLVFSEPVALNLSSGERIDTARLASGNIAINIANATALDASITISIPELELNGVAFTQNSSIPAGSNININNNLAGYIMIPGNDTVNINVTAASSGSNGVQVAVDQYDSISVDAAISNLYFNSVTGVLDNKQANFINNQEGLTVPDGFNNISLVAAVLTLDVENGIDLPGTLNIQLNGNNGKTLNITGNIAPKGTALSTLSTITNNNVADFLTPIPDSIQISGSVAFGDGIYSSTITDSDFVYASVNIYAPLYVKINNAEVTDLNVEKESINQQDIDIITDHVIDARFIYNIINHLPLGLQVIVHISGDSSSLYTTPQLTLDTMSIAPAPVSLITGITTSDTAFTGEIYLDSLDLQVLKNDTLFIRPEIYLNGSDTSGVQLTDNDYLTINGRIEVVYRFDGNF